MKGKLIYTLISVIMIIFLLAQINLQDAVTAFYQVNYFYLSLAYGFILLTYLLKAIRFHVFLEKRIGISDMFKIVSIHNLANEIFPARTGELSFIYLTKSRGIRAGHGLSILAMARALDFIIISISILLTTFLIEKTNIFLNSIITSVSIIFALIIISCMAVFRYKSKSLQILGKIAKTLGIRGRVFRFFKKHIKEICVTMENEKKKLKHIVLISIVLWIIFFISSLGLFLAFNVPINFIQVIFLASIISFLPIFYGPGGFGTFELSVSAILILFGVAKEVAIISSFGVHISGLIFVIVVGIICSILNKSSIKSVAQVKNINMEG